MIGMNSTSAWIKAALDALEKGIMDPKSVFCMIQAPAKAEGSAEAYFQLARFYHRGIGCDQDDVKALEMLIKSAEGGWIDAQYALGIRYYTGDFAPQNYSEAVKWFTLAAEQGHKSAANYLVDCYIHGQGVEKDSDEAIKWLGVVADGVDFNTPEEEDWPDLEDLNDLEIDED